MNGKANRIAQRTMNRFKPSTFYGKQSEQRPNESLGVYADLLAGLRRETGGAARWIEVYNH